jgi:hypothetical protein
MTRRKGVEYGPSISLFGRIQALAENVIQTTVMMMFLRSIKHTREQWRADTLGV